MISIITAIHNQLEINRIFYENLVKYTFHPFELIIVDNNSTDGSREFFKDKGAVVIENEFNFSYPYCQNQGIKISLFPVYAFLNNDIIVSPEWDKKLLEIMDQQELEIITPCGIERTETALSTKKFRKKWNLIKNFLSFTGDYNLMAKLMYGNWESFSNKRFDAFGDKTIEGFVGNTVVMKKSAIEKLGLWDEKIQAADFDLYIRSKKRASETGDIKPVHIALGVFNHHFIRMTSKSKPPVFKDSDRLMPLEGKWSKKEMDLYLKDNLTI
jgi:GT2 family glycosyltransferase